MKICHGKPKFNVSSKISKSIGILYRTRCVLNKKLLTQLYYSFIHSYLNYGNLAWASTNKTKLEVLYRHQKHAIRVINFKDRYTHTKPFFEEMKILDIYQMNITNILIFLFKCKLKTCPPIFLNLYKERPPNKYNMKSKDVLVEPACKTKLASFSISYRAPFLWNKLISPNFCKFETESLQTFKASVTKLAFECENIKDYF